jgi:hypothetical protein
VAHDGIAHAPSGRDGPVPPHPGPLHVVVRPPIPNVAYANIPAALEKSRTPFVQDAPCHVLVVRANG